MSFSTQRTGSPSHGKKVNMKPIEEEQFHETESSNAPPEQTQRQKEKARRVRRSTLFLNNEERDVTIPEDREQMPFHITNDMLEEDLQANLEEDDGADGADLAALRVLNQQRNELLARHKIECGNVESLKALVDKLELTIYRLMQENARLKRQQIEPDPEVQPQQNTREPERSGESELSRAPRGTPRARSEAGTATGKEKRSAKIPDPELLTDGITPNIEDWIVEMEAKLIANADHYDTEDLRITYINSRLGTKAKPYVRERMNTRHAQSFKTVEELLTVLELALGKPKEQKRAEARAEFKKLYQKQEKFSVFWADFQHLVTLLEKPEEDLQEELRDRISSELKRATASMEFKDVYALANKCMILEPRLEGLRSAEDRDQRFRKSATEIKMTKKTTASFNSGSKPKVTETTETTSIRPQYGDKNKQELSDKGLCFVCQKRGHMAQDCPNKPAKVQEMEVFELNANNSGKD